MAAARHDRTSEIGAFVLVAVATAIVAVTPYLLFKGAYIRDDMQAQYVPTFMAIGRSLLAGRFPWLTLQVAIGGDLVGEYQYALLNPVSLLSYAAIANLDNTASAAAVFATIHYVILGTGAYVLARAFHARRRYAALAALCFVMNNYVFYWFSSSWAPGLVGTAWLTWAVALLVRCHCGRSWWFGATLAIYLLLAAGWPQAVVAFALCAVVLLVMRTRRHGLKGGAAPALAITVAGLGALSSLLPLAAMATGAQRSSQIFNHALLEPNLSGVLAVSSPLHLGAFHSFTGMEPISVPMFYVAWFIAPLSVFLDWPRLRRRWQFWLPAGAAAVFALLTQGPEQLSVLHWPFRFLPYMHLSALVAFAVAATFGGFVVTRRRLLGAWALIALGLVGSLQATPDMAGFELFLTVVVMVLLALTVRPSARLGAMDALPMAGGAMVIFLATHLLCPQNQNVSDWRQPYMVGQVSDLAAIPTGYGLVAGRAEDMPKAARPPAFGNMGLLSNKAYFFGYSPIGLRSASEMFCVETHGSVCTQAAARIFGSAGAGKTWADLMKIDELVFMPSIRPVARPQLPPGWMCAQDGLCQRAIPRQRYPGSVSFATAGVDLRAAGVGSAEHEALLIRASNGGDITFARLVWKGYRATLDGVALPIESIGPGLLTVRIPRGSQPRTLLLSYAPPGLAVSLAAAACALALLLAVVMGWSRLGFGEAVGADLAEGAAP